MKAWILTAVLVVSLIGGAALAVAPDGDTVSDGTVVVDVLDISDVLVAPTHDAAYQQAQHSLNNRSSGVPAFANVFANMPLDGHDAYRHR